MEQTSSIATSHNTHYVTSVAMVSTATLCTDLSGCVTQDWKDAFQHHVHPVQDLQLRKSLMTRAGNKEI